MSLHGSRVAGLMMLVLTVQLVLFSQADFATNDGAGQRIFHACRLLGPVGTFFWCFPFISLLMDKFSLDL